MSPSARAFLATIIFAVAGISSFFTSRIWLESVGVLLAVIYALLVINTFFSIRFFSSLLPSDLLQKIIDTILVAFYLSLTFSMNDEVRFFLLASGLFLLASVKYVLLLKHTSYTKILWRKIRIDLVGAVSCAAALVGTLLGYSLESAWIFVIGFGILSVYLLLTDPAYHSSKEPQR